MKVENGKVKDRGLEKKRFLPLASLTLGTPFMEELSFALQFTAAKKKEEEKGSGWKD